MSQAESLTEDVTIKEQISRLRPKLVTPGGEVVEGPDGSGLIARLQALSDEDLEQELKQAQAVPEQVDPRLFKKIVDKIIPKRPPVDSGVSWIEPIARRLSPREVRRYAADRAWRIAVTDTTMRDGRRERFEPPSRADRIALARALDELGPDAIEVGSMAWDGDFRAVQHVAPTIERAVVCVLARCTSDLNDVRRAVEALRGARSRRRVNLALLGRTFRRMIATSEGRARVIDTLRQNVAFLKGEGVEVQISIENAVRIRFDFLRAAFLAAVEAGASILNVADTYGVATPEEFRQRVGRLKARLGVVGQVVHGREIILSAHCHNRMGLAVANTLAGVAAGARQVETTVNGIGTRGGNAALEEVVRNLDDRAGRLLPRRTDVRHDRLVAISQMVANMTGLVVPPNKPIVGDDECEGVATPGNIVARGAGRSEIEDRLTRCGFRPDSEELDRVVAAFKELARSSKGTIYESDLIALMVDQLRARPPRGYWGLDSFQVITGNRTKPQATVSLVEPVAGRVIEASVTGDGPVDAICKAIAKASSIPVNVSRSTFDSGHGGGDALSQVTLELEEGRRSYGGRAVSPDILEAAASACVEAINAIYQRRLREAAGEPAADTREDDPLRDCDESPILPMNRARVRRLA